MSESEKELLKKQVINLNRDLIKIAHSEEQLIDEVIEVSNKLNSVYSDNLGSDYFLKSINMMLEPIVSSINNLNYEVDTFLKEIKEEEVNLLLTNYVNSAREIISKVDSFKNDYYEKFNSYEDKIKEFDHKLTKYNKYNMKDRSEIDDEDLKIVVEDFLLTDMFYANNA